MNGLDFFSGYGGITLALRSYVTPMAYCEIEPYAQGILLSRIREGRLPAAPIWDDIETFPFEEFKDKTDIVYGGFPCTDISCAGPGHGLEGKRSGLFFQLAALVGQIRPRFVFLENVPAIRTRGLFRVVDTFAQIGYDCRWTCLTAKEVGSPQIRERWFLLAYSDSRRARQQSSHGLQELSQPADSKTRPVSHTLRERSSWRPETDRWKKYNRFRRRVWTSTLSGSRESDRFSTADPDPCGSESQNESRLVRTSNGYSEKMDMGGILCAGSAEENPWLGKDWEASTPRLTSLSENRVSRIKAIGNGVVPDQVRLAFKRLIGLESTECGN